MIDPEPRHRPHGNRKPGLERIHTVGRLQLENRNALITGASSGIGEAIAREMARRGARPILAARRPAELKRVAADIHRETGIDALCIAADIIRDTDRKRIAATIQKKLGRLHILVNNAGITAHGSFAATRLSVLRRTLEINFIATAELTRVLLPLMIEKIEKDASLAKDGRDEKVGQVKQGEQIMQREAKAIVYISSISGLYGIPNRFAYSTGKAAAQSLMECLRMEYAHENLHTMTFCPGYVKTDLRAAGIDAKGRGLKEEQHHRAISPDEAARKLCQALQKKRRIAFTDINGLGVYWLRILVPSFLEYMIRRRTLNRP